MSLNSFTNEYYDRSEQENFFTDQIVFVLVRGPLRRVGETHALDQGGSELRYRSRSRCPKNKASGHQKEKLESSRRYLLQRAPEKKKRGLAKISSPRSRAEAPQTRPAHGPRETNSALRCNVDNGGLLSEDRFSFYAILFAAEKKKNRKINDGPLRELRSLTFVILKKYIVEANLASGGLSIIPAVSRHNFDIDTKGPSTFVSILPESEDNTLL
ncbi:hypothetical protein EVAR_92037_1 [Eumeta japonica]|uniref:Uncharacterized protein n=1 Tax=Eumeta variegata TaxID=151549 RepID=A0A4C1T0Q8_EUMVA|nr:hypothetical protein EVAR_92037_1 [Eumeta japonica]